VTAIAGGEVSGLNVTLQVEPATEEVDLSGIVGVSSGSSWQLYKDITGQMLIPTKYASDLRNGDNTYYIVVNSDDGKINRTYTLNIYKNYYVTVKYVSENNVFHSEEVLAGTTLETGPTIERDGYVFNGWGVEGYIVTEPVTFRANWTPKQYTITLNADGGNVSNNQQVITMHDEFRLPTASGKRGYSFDGWYTADGYKVAESNGAGSSVWNYASDMTLYAGWKKSQYSVSLNKNIVAAGTVYGASTGIDYNDSTTITAETNVGYTWLGWYEGGNKVTSSMSYTFNVPSRNSSYTAKWYKLDVTKNISVAGNISELTGTYKVGDSVTVTAETNVGYAWLGWYEGDTKVSSGADLAYTFQMPVAKKTYEARWKAKEYTVTLNPNSGTGVPASMNVTYGANYEIPTPTYEGYGLEGWFLDADKIDNTGIWNIDSNVELVAKWKITDYTITYNLNGGTVSSENANQTSYTIESLDITLNNPTRTGYNFIGWSGTELTGSTNMSVTITNGSTGDRSYTANWSTIEYTIGYTLNDGEVAIANLTKYTVETETFSLNNPTKNGYTFRGWSGTDLIGSNNTMVTITKGSYGERTYTANWTPTPYNINYTLNGGIISYENANPTSYTIESLDITLNNPTRTGYNFIGWSGTELTGSTNMSVTITNGSTGDRSYTANWSTIEYTIGYTLNDGEVAIANLTKYTVETETFSLNNPTKNGYTFRGWSGTDLIGSNNTMVTITKGSYGERTYTANWTPTPYNINYTLNGGIISYENANPTSYTIESLDITLNNPTKTGYNFVGWSGTELAGSTNMSVTIVNGSTGDRSYTANWEAITTSVTFDINGGNSLSPDTTTISYDSTINFPIPTHSDPTQAFTGWYTDMAAGERITDNLGKGLNVWNKNGFEIQAWAVEDTTIILYARWGDASVPQYQRIDADGNLDATGTHILFGEWPQTIKTSDVTITETIDSRGYYLGNDGEYYARVVANPRTTNYKFSNNANVEIGTVYYFKVKPIKWRILNITNGKALILCESIVANMRYNYYYSGSQNGIYSHNYVESEIRAWLNQEFYNKAFSNLQKEIIQITEVDNSTYSTGYTGSSGAQYECGNTNDMIFLPSYREIINAGYGFNSNFDNNDGSRIRKVSDYSIATGVSMNTSTDYYRNAAYWWLRSPYYSWANSCYVRCIDYRGKGLNCENINNSNRVDNTSVGVVPALVIDLT